MIVVTLLDEMGKFVDYDVFEAFHWFLGKFEIQPDASGDWIAGAPAGFHLLDAAFGKLNPHRGLPFRQEWWNQFPELLAIPMRQDLIALANAGIRSHIKLDDGLVA